ncbi:MYXO-CTERM sorting domain-containing protein [Enhygromyxa salina]|uniref:MYXO-CTERM sorting domain-containing protein n=1 Tax=Enhygromyxa salina TaxID=215803 RepID=UPI002158A17C|nr:MYXO-CTERM sorting domain-containing protein [Enhygromyxa salina]
MLGSAAYLALSSVAWAGTITAEGNVIALDDITQVSSVTGTALFDEATIGEIPLDQYADQGLTFHVGELATILPGVMEAGESINPRYVKPGMLFPWPIGGGGVQLNSIVFYAGAVTFSDSVTQFGLTAGSSSVQYITAWDQAGVMIGQVKWEPGEDEEASAAFVGIDTMGTPIGMLTYGNDDVWGGETYDVVGDGSSSDSWIWGTGQPCATEADCFDDMGPCNVHMCSDGACSYPATTEPCDDNNACTEADTCSEGLCSGTEVNCSDGLVCTFDTCDPARGCSNDAIEGCCLGDEDCPEGWMCIVSSNTCVEGPPPPPPPPPDETDDGDESESDSGGETGPAVDEDGGGGCGCTSEERGSGALLGLLALVVLGSTRRRRDDAAD